MRPPACPLKQALADERSALAAAVAELGRQGAEASRFDGRREAEQAAKIARLEAEVRALQRRER